MRSALGAVRGLLVLLALTAFVMFVWPTRWRYDHMTLDGNLVPVRIDRLTGDADMLVPDEGWQPVEAPPQPGSTVSGMPS